MLKIKNKNTFTLAVTIFLFLFYVPSTAIAKRVSFGSRSAFGLGFRGGIAENPIQSFTSTPQTTSTNYTKIIGFEPFLDFDNFSLRATMNLHLHPLVQGSGTDNILGQNFTESSDASTFSYGIKLLLVPYRNTADRIRIYLGVGAGLANLYAANTRNYHNTSGTVTATYVEKVRGSSSYTESLLGLEFFLVQNYSLALETGYKTLNFEKPTYYNSNDVRGTTIEKGSTVKNVSGTDETFTYNGFNFSISFNLHF